MERDIGDLTGSDDLGESDLFEGQDDESELRLNRRMRSAAGSRSPSPASTDSGKGVTA